MSVTEAKRCYESKHELIWVKSYLTILFEVGSLSYRKIQNNAKIPKSDNH